MEILDFDLLIMGGGGGGVGRAKFLAPCISFSVKVIFKGLVGCKVSVLSLRPRLVLVIFLLPGIRGLGGTVGCQDVLGCYGNQHVV